MVPVAALLAALVAAVPAPLVDEPDPAAGFFAAPLVERLRGGAPSAADRATPPGGDAVVDDALADAGLTGEPMPAQATGRLRTVPLTAPAVAVPPPDHTLRTVRVEVEEGLPVDAAAFADRVMTILTDERGWVHDGAVQFVRTDAPADVTVVLASPALTDALCAPLRTGGEVSCANAGRAVLNAVRWAEGAEPFLAGGGTLTGYHEYLVNHEVGHLLGHGHASCPAPGAPAPVMVQQTLDLEGCAPNGWPATAAS